MGALFSELFKLVKIVIIIKLLSIGASYFFPKIKTPFPALISCPLAIGQLYWALYNYNWQPMSINYPIIHRHPKSRMIQTATLRPLSLI